MHKDYSKYPDISKKLCLILIDYYDRLFENYEIKTTGEICEDLSISNTTLRRFFAVCCPSELNDMTRLGLKILLCTKFTKSSPYFEIQKNFLKEIRKRQIRKTVKQKILEMNKK